MTYAWGASSVIGQPPQVARQYALPARMSSARATASAGRRRTCTFAGRAFSISVRRALPVAHFIQYALLPIDRYSVAPPSVAATGHDSDGCGKPIFHGYAKLIRGVKRQKARLQPRSPRPLGSLLKSACKRPQLPSRFLRLSSSFRLQADGRSLVFVGVNPISCPEVYSDYVAHSSVSQSIGKPGWPALVISE